MLTDIYATVLELAGVTSATPTPHSRSLLGTPAVPGRPVIAEYTGANASLTRHLRNLNPELDTSRLEVAYAKVRVGRLEFTVGSDGSEILHDLVADPGRERNVAPGNPGTVNALFELLPAVELVEEEGLEIDEEMREWLRSLGYIR